MGVEDFAAGSGRGKIIVVAVLWAVLLGSGCSDSPLPLEPVAGKVTYNGQPLDHGQVVFSPSGGTPGPQAVGNIQTDGTYRMRTLDHDGASIGPHIVTVHCREQKPSDDRSLAVPQSLIPNKYSSQQESPLRFEVREGKNEFPIELE